MVQSIINLVSFLFNLADSFQNFIWARSAIVASFYIDVTSKQPKNSENEQRNYSLPIQSLKNLKHLGIIQYTS